MDRHILVLNAGSSSIKFGLFRFSAEGREDELLRGAIDGLGDVPRFRVRDPSGALMEDAAVPPDSEGPHAGALRLLTTWIDTHLDDDAVAAIGHRVVHGGEAFTSPVRITPEALVQMEALSPLAPLHQPHNLAPMRLLARLFPDVPQVACFDTAFHATMPPLARMFAIPRDWTERGMRRYGFHGLSYEYVAGLLASLDPRLARGRTLVAHLGSGASLCLLEEGRSVATSMGLSALDGLMMGTRSGALDPGVIFHLMRQGMSADAIEHALYSGSGLLGVSALSGDMRKLRAAQATSAPAREAVALFTRTLIGEIGRMIALARGIDGLVFTAGIGENDAQLRADVLEALAWAGFRLDVARNSAGEGVITTDDGPCARVVRTDEERMIARHTHRTALQSQA